MQLRLRPLFVAALAATAGACSGDPIGSRQMLSPEEVSGVYMMCSLTFTPTGVLPPVDIRAAATDTAPPSALPRPNLKLARTSATHEVEFTPRGDVVPTRLTGRYTLGAGTVRLDFGTQQAQARGTLLLPAALTLRADVPARALTIAPEQTAHRVPRADYARLAGVAEANLQPEIEGTLAGRFAAACP